MKKGPASFLTSRPPLEAFEMVKKLYVEEGFSVRKVAIRVGVHYRSLYKWLTRYPEFGPQLEKIRAEAFEKAVQERQS